MYGIYLCICTYVAMYVCQYVSRKHASLCACSLCITISGPWAVGRWSSVFRPSPPLSSRVRVLASGPPPSPVLSTNQHPSLAFVSLDHFTCYVGSVSPLPVAVSVQRATASSKPTHTYLMAILVHDPPHPHPHPQTCTAVKEN